MKLITLDFEGTLVNFQWKLSQAVAEATDILAQNGIKKDIFKGMNYATIYNLVLHKEKEWSFSPGYLGGILDEIYDKYDIDAASRWQPVAGLAQTLNELGGYQLALVSNIGQKGLTEVLSKFGLDNSFKFRVTRNDIELLKPEIEGLEQVIKQAQVSKEDVIHIGDSLADLFAARKAGIKAGIVLGGENKPEVLRREHPDLVLDKFSELPNALKTMGF